MKRRKLNLVNGSWVEQEKIYYIRSTVLGGAVVTEADANGRKKKTFVKAAGATIAEQHVFHNPGNNTDTETLVFEQFDASGLSYRATMGADGSTITGEGADGSPAEMDLMGGNVGLSSPYYEINPNPPAEEFPGQRLLTDEQPMYVNGQQVRAYMDGIEIPWSLALSSLANGSAIPAALAPFQHLQEFRFENHGLGIYTGTIFERVNLPNANYGVGQISISGYRQEWLPRDVSFYFPSWNLQQHQNQDNEPRNTGTGNGQGGGQPQKGVSPDCIQLLKDYGVWDKVQEILKNPLFEMLMLLKRWIKYHLARFGLEIMPTMVKQSHKPLIGLFLNQVGH